MSIIDRSALIKAQLEKHILLIDGGMGTMIQSYQFEEQDYRGERFSDWVCDVKGNNDLLVLTQPEVIANIHREYLDAGADILETNTFNANRISQSDYGLEEYAYEINVKAAEVAKRAVSAFMKSISLRGALMVTSMLDGGFSTMTIPVGRL